MDTSAPVAPVVPSASDLATLNPVVAVTLLIVVALGITLFYVGPAIKSRLSPTATAKPDPAAPAANALPAAVDRSAEITDRYIASLEAKLADERTSSDRVIGEKDREIARLNDLIQRDQTWRRGNP